MIFSDGYKTLLERLRKAKISFSMGHDMVCKEQMMSINLRLWYYSLLYEFKIDRRNSSKNVTLKLFRGL